jgi:RNHCP domain
VARRFTRTQEDFVCLVCGVQVRGDGYTNHCPSCLWSRHVDVNPGDRAADCRGLMRPVSVQVRTHDLVLTHRCERCGQHRRNRTTHLDDTDALARLAAAVVETSAPAGWSAPDLTQGRLRGRGRWSAAPRPRGRRR